MRTINFTTEQRRRTSLEGQSEFVGFEVLGILSTNKNIYAGLAEIDTLNNIYRFNVSFLSFTGAAGTVQNSNPRSTELLMFDVVTGNYTTDLLYKPGTNFSWEQTSCWVSPIPGPGTVREISRPDSISVLVLF